MTTYHNTVTPHSPTRSLKQGSDACSGGYECTSFNGLILSSKNSLFQIQETSEMAYFFQFVFRATWLINFKKPINECSNT